MQKQIVFKYTSSLLQKGSARTQPFISMSSLFCSVQPVHFEWKLRQSLTENFASIFRHIPRVTFMLQQCTPPYLARFQHKKNSKPGEEDYRDNISTINYD